MPKRKRGNGTGSGNEPPLAEYLPYKPDAVTREAARARLHNNKHINNLKFRSDPEYFRVLLRSIQTTYKVRVQHNQNLGYRYRIRLIWDHDRIWGAFEIESFRGVLLIDPGPGQDHFPQGEYDYHDKTQIDKKPPPPAGARDYSLEWRGTSRAMPNVLFYSTLTIGKIRFSEDEIWGHFDLIRDMHDRCYFHGQRLPGPRLVPLSISDVIEEWNELGPFCDEEAPRESDSDVEGPNDEAKKKTAARFSSHPEARKLNEEEREKLLKSITGVFDISSESVEKEWPGFSEGLTLRLHADKQQNKLWGYIDVGIVEGYINLKGPLGDIVPEELLKLKWRGRENEEGTPKTGSGRIMISEDETVSGVLRGTEHYIEFKGKKRSMLGNSSGHDASYYRKGWQQFPYSLNFAKGALKI